ncbi:condensation domain-containing protein [Pyxidicoccus xibeiensis]|uniref:condensation domain-containing protein n=1 Tax=Pyxidicoccus xibeiensis TaxID=2906759 RepID=UPI0020A7B08A|nr:condensation domain-containing protein [Pyxidicoccus xibeiensis]MCP3144577.1 condensation domain-containing protein [Pyxidicoccus xibeiensis]
MSSTKLLLESSTLVELSRRRAEAHADQRAYTFLVDGEGEEAHLTYAELDRRARAIGGFLQARGARGERVLLLYPPGLDYVAAFVGCLYAGAVAVPAYPPDPMRVARTLPRLEAVIQDARARFALTTGFIQSVAESLGEQSAALAGLTWVATDALDDAEADGWKDPGARRESLAFLQYTSGSTGTPRGVMLSHGNLLHNSLAIHRCFEHTEDSRGVIWLPPYHDMGLIGGVLQPLCGGFPVVLMSPLDFLKRPARWLEAISRYRATTSGGPNFAFDLCVRKTTPEQRAALDLSSWDVAFNGAEPVRAETLERFAQAFAGSGFRKQAFYPCYGLAEATLIASGGRKLTPPVERTFVGEALQQGRAEAAEPGADGARVLVGCGQRVLDQELLVVDPESRVPSAAGRLGEIWVRGESVAASYWERAEESEATFRAHRADTGEGPYLRTGDLGFLAGGELFVAGRIKDLIILRGRNHYPQDLELTAEGSHPAMRPGCSAAFAVEAGGEERLVVVMEVDRKHLAEPSEAIDAIRRAIAGAHEVAVGTVVLIPAGGLPKTSSGKVQRRACRAMYQAGELEVLAEDRGSAAALAASDAPMGVVDEAPALTRDTLRAASEAERARLLGAWLRSRLARALSMPAAALESTRPLTALGLDSIHAVELKGALEEELGVSVPVSLLLEGVHLDALTARALAELRHPTAVLPPLEAGARGESPPLSYAQERLLFLEQLAAGTAAYNIPAAVELEGALDVAVLGRALEAIVHRHEVLRTRFPRVSGRPTQVILRPEAVPGPLSGPDAVVDLGALPEPERMAEVERLTATEARRPFDLEHGLPVRARLLRLSERQHRLLLTLHHVVSDGWTMGVLVRELGALYAAFVQGRPSPLPALPVQYADHAAWLRRWLEGGELEAELTWWKERLAGAPALLELPTDRLRPDRQRFEGARHPLALSPALTAGLRQLGQAEGATPFMSLLAGFLVVLHARTGRTDVVVGTDVANREHARSQGLVGLFVNQLVLRVGLDGNPTFRAVLGRVREVALGGYARPHVPFDKLVEALRPPRDARYNPLFQVMFVLENAPLPALKLPGLELRQVEVDDGGSPFDVSVLLSESGGRFHGVLRYATALFDAPTIARLAADYEAVLATAVARPDITLEELRQVLAEHERQRQQARAQELQSARKELFRNVRRRGGSDS